MKFVFDVREKYENSGKKCRALLLVFGAVLFSVSFSYECMWFLNWIALVPLALNIFTANKTSKRVFRSLFCFFSVFYVCAYSWLVSLYPLDFAGLGNVESILVIVTGLTVVPLLHSFEMSAAIWLSNKLSCGMGEGFVKCVCLSLGYVLGEWLQGIGPLGFPWARVYVSQIGALQNLQSASVFGACFVTFAVALVNFLVGSALFNRQKAKIYSFAAAIIFAGNFLFGSIAIWATQNNYIEEKSFDVVALQGNVGSYEKWSTVEKSYSRYLALAQSAGEYCDENNLEPKICVIPETAFPVTALWERDGKMSQNNKVTSLNKTISKTLGCTVLSGVFVSYNEDDYNSLVCFDESGITGQMYHKQKLVPFGEFVPCREFITTFLPFLSEINMLSSDLSQGNITNPMKMRDVRVAGLVCFDSVFAECLRGQVKNGADIIAVSTNDSWYKTSKALDQHAAHSVMRAIENRKPLVRSANTGISMLIESTGKIVEKSGVNETDFVAGTLHFSDERTLYTSIGDVTLYCAFLAMAYLAVRKIIEKVRC